MCNSKYIEEITDKDLLWLKLQGFKQVTARMMHEDVLVLVKQFVFPERPIFSSNFAHVNKTYLINEPVYVLFGKSAIILHPGEHTSKTKSFYGDNQSEPTKEILYNQKDEYIITIKSIDSNFIEGVGLMVIGLER